MFHSYAIIHPDEQTRQSLLDKCLAKLSLHPVDLWQTDDDNVSIDLVRDLKMFFSRAPFASPYKVAVIQADRLSLEAQQALLKTLEEPPPKSTIFLLAQQAETLLPTILSRCSIISEKTTPQPAAFTSQAELIRFWKSLLSRGGGERLKETKSFSSDRKDVKIWLETQILFFRQELIDRVTTGTSRLLLSPQHTLTIVKLLNRTARQIDQNLSLRLVLDHLLLDLPPTTARS